MNSIIKISNLHKQYSATKKNPAQIALGSVSIEIEKGSIFGLLGPNGAGKSTIINIIVGLVKKTAGKVVINGIDMDEFPRKTRYEIGVVPQEVVLDPFFPVRETLEFYAGYYGVPKNQRITDELLEALYLKDKANVNSRRLSGGMKRRVLIAKALVHKPRILILDEPTAGVDVELRSQLWDYVRKLNKQGTTVLLTTHYLEEAEELCDRVAIINHGSIIANDSTRNLMQTIDQKEVKLSFTSLPTKIPEIIEKFNPTCTEDNSLTFLYKRKEASMDQILHAISEAGLVVKDISTKEPDLEDVFKFLTK